MFVHHISYRYENGDIEEFVGFGLTPASAQQNSVFCATGVVRSTRGEAFTPARVSDITALRQRQNANRKTRVSGVALNLEEAFHAAFAARQTFSRQASAA